MKFTIVVLLILSCALFTSAQPASDAFKKLQSLRGTWAMQSKKGMLFESWCSSNDSTMAGKTYRLINERDTLLMEEMTLILRNNDVLFVTVVQDSKIEVAFKLDGFLGNTFSFNNANHDFPQRVVYQLPVNDQLHAWVEGMDMGSHRKEDYYYKKIR